MPSTNVNVPHAPPSIEALDFLMQQIDFGEAGFAPLSDEQRNDLKAGLADEWLSAHLDDYPVPADPAMAASEYRAIRSGALYPYLPERVRSDLLIQFDQQFAEGGGPGHWTDQYRAI